MWCSYSTTKCRSLWKKQPLTRRVITWIRGGELGSWLLHLPRMNRLWTWTCCAGTGGTRHENWSEMFQNSSLTFQAAHFHYALHGNILLAWFWGSVEAYEDKMAVDLPHTFAIIQKGKNLLVLDIHDVCHDTGIQALGVCILRCLTGQGLVESLRTWPTAKQLRNRC